MIKNMRSGGRYRCVLILQPVGFWLGLVLRRRGYTRAEFSGLWRKHSGVAQRRLAIDQAEYDHLSAKASDALYPANETYWWDRSWQIST